MTDPNPQSSTATQGAQRTDLSIAIVGAGPRGISIIERIAAYLQTEEFSTAHSQAVAPVLTLHLVDDAEHGAGRIWQTDQTRTLCMNTLAGAVTLFTEPGATVNASVLEGPTQYEWIRLLLDDRENIADEKIATFDAHRPSATVLENYREELESTREESNPSRALYGEYLRWALEVALAQLPETVSVIHHHCRAVNITPAATDEGTATDTIELTNGEHISSHATVLATGWQTPAPTTQEDYLAQVVAETDLQWVSPNNPLDQDLGKVPDGGQVLVRGLGMGFFDVMALLTIDRGGVFSDDPTARSGLRYTPSGREPHIVVSSGRGYPFLPKSEYHSLPPKAKQERLKKVIAKHSAAGSAAAEQPLDFGADVWPAIVRDAYAEYYEKLAEVRPEALTTSLEEILSIIDSTELPAHSSQAPATLTAALSSSSTEPFALEEWMTPLANILGSSANAAELSSHIAERMAGDIREAVSARRSPLKAGLWALSTARKPASILGANGRYTAESRQGSFREFMALGGMAGSGPPLFRTRQLLALVDAGLVTFLGPRPTVTATETEFVMSSEKRQAQSTVLIDAWMHQPDVRASGDPLVRRLVEDKRVRAFCNGNTPTGSPETTDATRQAVRSDGTADPRVHIVGIPTYAQWPDTTISPMPGTDPLMLQETDKTAASLLRIACN